MGSSGRLDALFIFLFRRVNNDILRSTLLFLFYLRLRFMCMRYTRIITLILGSEPYRNLNYHLLVHCTAVLQILYPNIIKTSAAYQTIIHEKTFAKELTSV